MKRRYLYSILFGIPGLIVSAMLTLLLFGAATGFLWLFVFGDSPWPSWNEALVTAALGLVFLVIWLASIIAGFIVGKRLEQKPGVNRIHILISAGITAVLLLVIFISQVSNGNLGPKSAETRCSEFCSTKGFSASSVSPRISANRTCSCLNELGVEIIQVPVETLESPK